MPNTVVDEESAKPSTSTNSMNQTSTSSGQCSSEKSWSFINKAINQPSSSITSLCKPSSSSNSPCEKTSSYDPFPSTSTHASETCQPVTEVVIKQEPHDAPADVAEPIIKSEPMEIVTTNAAGGVLWQNGHQILPQLTPLNIKTEPVRSVAVSQIKTCDKSKVSNQQQVVSPSPNVNQIASPPVNTTLPALKGSGKKTYVKCVGKDGKVSLMELVRDEKNPKLFKMVLPPGVNANKMVLQRTNSTGTPVVIPTNFMRPMAPTGNAVEQVKIGVPLMNSSPTANLLSVAVARSTLIPANTSTLAATSFSTPTMSSNFASPVKLPLANTHTAVASSSTQLVNRRISMGNLISPSKNQLPTMPKLVAINSPHRPIPPPKIVVPQPKITSVSATHAPSGMQKPNLTPITSVIQKNNKILVLDANRLPKNQQKSLLKPQVSLLKPRAMLTASSQQHTKITVSNISGLENRNINVFVPADVKLQTKIPTKSQTNSHVHNKYGAELEQRFLARKTFTNMTEAIGWLLKETPLISSLATQSEFRESFPFAVSSLADFHSLHIAKQRSFEVRLLTIEFIRKFFV